MTTQHDLKQGNAHALASGLRHQYSRAYLQSVGFTLLAVGSAAAAGLSGHKDWVDPLLLSGTMVWARLNHLGNRSLKAQFEEAVNKVEGPHKTLFAPVKDILASLEPFGLNEFQLSKHFMRTTVTVAATLFNPLAGLTAFSVMKAMDEERHLRTITLESRKIMNAIKPA